MYATRQSCSERAWYLARCIVVTCLSAATVLAATTSLFSMSIRHEAPEQPGVLNNYTMTFTEIERSEATSIVEVVHAPPRYSDHGDMLIGMCGLLNARGEKFMLGTLRLISREPLRQEVTFLRSAPDSDREQLRAGIVSLSQCSKYLAH